MRPSYSQRIYLVWRMHMDGTEELVDVWGSASKALRAHGVNGDRLRAWREELRNGSGRVRVGLDPENDGAEIHVSRDGIRIA